MINVVDARKNKNAEVLPVFMHFRVLGEPLESGKNVQCMVVELRKGTPEQRGTWLTYSSKDGPSTLVHHLECWHKAEYNFYLGESRQSKRNQRRRKDVTAGETKYESSSHGLS